MARRIPVVAIVGRTNVGKSTLFNRLAGRDIAVVDNAEGITRDRSYTLIKRHGFPFYAVDTGGLVADEPDDFFDSVIEQTEVAASEADAIIVLFDGLHGAHPLDREVVEKMRQHNKPLLWVANKCEKPSTELLANELYGLGIENLQCISAAHGVGIRELMEQLRNTLAIKGDESFEREEMNDDGAIRVAILGRPNVGKSTIINKILGEQRLITSDVAGTTRDAVDITLTRDGQHFILVDTAGLRKKARVSDGTVERYSNLRTLKAMAKCDVVVLLLDATQGPPSEQETKIAGLAHERGRGLIIVVNKWDAIDKDHRTVKQFKDSVYDALKFAAYAPVLFVSALSGRRCPSVLEKAKEVALANRERIQTADLNRVLSAAWNSKPPPAFHGDPVKLFFATQISEAPPTFVLFVNHPSKINFAYQRYLKNSIRKEYPFQGCPINVLVRKKTKKNDDQHRK